MPELAELRPPHGRWTPSRKALVVLAIRQGAVDRRQAIGTLALSPEELADWERRFDRAGQRGLNITARKSAID